ncbi:MAG TPA: response regulator transcription factor [Clostridia bacterium]
MYTIMIIEDDQVIAGLLKEHLVRWGYTVETVADFSLVTECFARVEPHLVLMDIALPFYNGYYWCGEIRKLSKVPVVFLSSASDNMNIVMAMQMGGDDFIAKPFDLDVVSAKIQAMLRRTYAFGQQVPLLEHQGVFLNLADASFSWNDVRIPLSRNEFRILQVLMEGKGAVVSRETLMKKLWASDCYIDDNTLSVNIARLRKTLDDAGLPDFIQTRKGMGYSLGT